MPAGTSRTSEPARNNDCLRLRFVNLGSTELLIIVVLVVVVFGAGWLPKAARNLGRAKVEIDKTQKQLTEAKQQVVEATGMDKAEATLRKANRALNQSPKSLIKGAAISAIGPVSDKAAEPAEPTELEGNAGASPDTETLNVDWAPDDAD